MTIPQDFYPFNTLVRPKWYPFTPAVPPPVTTVFTLFDQVGGGPLAAGDNSDYTFGMEFSLTQNCSLTGVWWYSAPLASELPTVSCIFDVTSTDVVAGTENDSPVWSGAAGSGWVKCTYDGSVTLQAGTNYKVAIFGPPATGWYSGTSGYWNSGGDGANGLQNGPIVAPSAANSTDGQDTYHNGAGHLAYPTGSNGGNYWVDVEVTTLAEPNFSGFPNALTTGPAAGGFNNLIPVTLDGSNFQITGDPPYPSYCQVQGDGSILIEACAFTGTAPIYFSPNSSRKLIMRGCTMAISGGQSYSIDCAGGGIAEISYCTFGAPDLTITNSVEKMVGFSIAGSSLDHCNLYWWQQAIAFGVENISVTACYIHNPVLVPAAHVEAFVIGEEAVDGLVISGNTITNWVNQTACIYLMPNVDVNNVLISSNLLGGGGYVLYLGYQPLVPAAVTNETVENNSITTVFYSPAGGFFGTATYFPTFGSNGNVWSGNTWFDGADAGQTVPVPT